MLAAALMLGLGPFPVSADEVDEAQARELVAQGVIRPLPQVLAHLATLYPGTVLKAELEAESHDGAPFLRYEIKLLAADGRVLKIIIDARTMAILKVKGRQHRPVEGATRGGAYRSPDSPFPEGPSSSGGFSSGGYP